jgi:CHASE2 domain-containing sensor protein
LADSANQSKPALWISVKNAVLRRSVASVFILVILWNISVSSPWLSDAIEGNGAWSELFREIRDTNLYLQMRFYQLLTFASPIKMSPNNIRLVYIDDQTHWSLYGGLMPTNRKFLADLINIASAGPGHVSAIGLDIELLVPRNRDEGDDADPLREDDKLLLKAVQDAAIAGVPVILAGAFYNDGNNRNFRLPNIFTPQQLRGDPAKIDCARARCPAFGYIEIPNDKRQIPINEETLSQDGTNPLIQDSFALALAKAVRDPAQVNQALNLEDGHPYDHEIFGTFLPEQSYGPISALSLYNGNPAELKDIAGKILLIGGHWRDLQGHGKLIDSHLSPVGFISGIGLHANYLASILSGKFAHALPLWFDIVMDILLGLVIYTSFKIARGRRVFLVLLITGLAPILLAYLFLVTANLYLDFLLPIELYFLHIAFEMLLEHHAEKKKHSGTEPPGQIPQSPLPAIPGPEPVTREA